MIRDFSAIVSEHRARYPLMEAQDLVKLAYQSEFGPSHLAGDGAETEAALLAEWREAAAAPTRPPEDIGGGLCRFHLGQTGHLGAAAHLLAALFLRTARSWTGTSRGLEDKLALLDGIGTPGMAAWLAGYRAQGCPPVHHSRAFAQAYLPHYRLLRQEYAVLFPALLAIAVLAEGSGPAVAAIDGRCGSGKTTLAELAAQLFPCNVFHMDDFYLPLHRRPRDWALLPGGNMDLLRFRREVLAPALAGEEVSFRPYDCRSGQLLPEIRVPPRPLTIVEGSYSHHPVLDAR